MCVCVCTAGQEHFYTTEGYEQGTNVLRIVGYFSLVGLLRVHTLVGDYHGALKALGVINPFQRSHLFTPKIASEAPYPLVPPPECLLKPLACLKRLQPWVTLLHPLRITPSRDYHAPVEQSGGLYLM